MLIRGTENQDHYPRNERRQRNSHSQKKTGYERSFLIWNLKKIVETPSNVDGVFILFYLVAGTFRNQPMELQLSTPGLLFSAITLLMLAYTNRFLAMANLIRGLHKKYLENSGQEKILIGQIKNLRKRLNMIKNMQIFGVLSFLLCVICMFLLYQDFITAANWIFMGSMLCLLVSLAISLLELQISTNALNLELLDMEDVLSRQPGTGLDQFFTKKD